MSERTTPSQPRSKKRSVDEGRAWVRYACNADISFQPLGARPDGDWRPAALSNVSAKGIGLVMDARAQRGTILTVMIEGAAQRFSRPLLVRVTRATERADGRWQVGCTFAIPLGEEELGALVPAEQLGSVNSKAEPKPSRPERERPAQTHDPFIQGSANERRRFPRRHIAVPLSLHYGAVWDQSQDALAIDSSFGGLKLLTRQAFGRGTILRARSTKAPAQVPSVEVRVQSCAPQGTKWVIAAKFLQQPSAETMLYFS